MEANNYISNFDAQRKEIFLSLTSKSDLGSQMDLELLIGALSKKLTLRQAMILRLKILDGISQVEISKLLGFSTPTISLEMKKIKHMIKKFYSTEFKIDVE